MGQYKSIYVGEEFPEHHGKEVTVWDSMDSKNPCYTMLLNGEEIDNMHDEDFEALIPTQTK